MVIGMKYMLSCLQLKFSTMSLSSGFGDPRFDVVREGVSNQHIFSSKNDRSLVTIEQS